MRGCWSKSNSFAPLIMMIFYTSKVDCFALLPSAVHSYSLHELRANSRLSLKHPTFSTYSKLEVNRVRTRSSRSWKIPATCTLSTSLETVTFSVLLSKILGYCIVAGSFFLQLPQVVSFFLLFLSLDWWAIYS